MTKMDVWSPGPNDEDFEIEASNSWLTGTSRGPADEFNIRGLVPEKHGISETLISNCGDQVSNEVAPAL